MNEHCIDLQGYLVLPIDTNHKVVANDQRPRRSKRGPHFRGTRADLDPISFRIQLAVFEGLVQHSTSGRHLPKN